MIVVWALLVWLVLAVASGAILAKFIGFGLNGSAEGEERNRAAKAKVRLERRAGQADADQPVRLEFEITLGGETAASHARREPEQLENGTQAGVPVRSTSKGGQNAVDAEECGRQEKNR